MELLTNFDLENLCKRYKLNLIQCDSKNKINKKPDRNKVCCYIINLDNEDGTHWTCMICYYNECYYFDSYGIIMPHEIIKFCKKNKLKLTYNQTQIQSFESVLCGYFCFYFLYYMTKHAKRDNMRKLLNLFIEPFDSINQEKNDSKIQYFIKQIFK